MPKPYSQDLRDRVIDAVDRGEMSRRSAARCYGIRESVAILKPANKFRNPDLKTAVAPVSTQVGKIAMARDAKLHEALGQGSIWRSSLAGLRPPISF
jgi:transposase